MVPGLQAQSIAAELREDELPLTAKEEISFSTFELRHSGHSTRLAEPITILSNRVSHSGQRYSKIGMAEF